MADRFFTNGMPDYIPENSPVDPDADSLTQILNLPLTELAEGFKKQALDIKETVVRETWVAPRKRVNDFTLYTGSLGTAFLLFKSYQVTKDKKDLALSAEIIKACYSAARGSSRVTFICGKGGICALGAVVAKLSGDEQLCHQYLAQFKQIKLDKDLPDELLYGRGGYLWACTFINKNIGEGTLSTTTMRAVVDEIINSGKKLGDERCPLMYEWYGKKYWGAAHGLAGIMHILMDMNLKADEVELVQGTLRHMIQNRFIGGNYPSSEGKETDRLVHWCHGAPGLALTLTKAAKVFNSEEFLHAAIDASEVVWNRGLLKRVGICHGISGNAYVFLSLYQLTGNPEYLYRAKAFACFLRDRAAFDI